MNYKKLIIIALGLNLYACSTQNVSYDYDRGQNFDLIKSYQIQFKENTIDELDRIRITESLTEQLHQKGLEIAQIADVVIEIQQEEFITKSQTSNVGIGLGTGNFGFGSTINVGLPISGQKLNQNYWVRMLKNDGTLIWDSKLEITMPVNASPETRENNIKKGVSKLLKNYPPK